VNPEFILSELQQRDDYEGQLVVQRRMPERPARYADVALPLHDDVAAALRRLGIERLFTHQAETVNRLRAGLHTVVATGTASGKTLAYHIPVIESVLDGGVALYLSPTKALAQDQLRQVDRLGVESVRAETYDGDTPSGARASIRRKANIVLTNPDMLHVGILPHHQLWTAFLKRLAFVVVDEAHVLRGIFGSHVALVLRRLRRVAARYGADPTFAFASATIGNPDEHASALCGLRVGAVTDDGAPTGERHFAFWNPPFLSEADQGKRRSSNVEASKLVAELVDNDSRTLAFSKSRVAAELVAKYARREVSATRPDRIVAYRAGYLARERRDIEQGLQDGRYPGVSATDALELGIDVGGLDAVVLNGFPGTVASARQQAGRAGRAGQPSLAVVVPRDEPLDQYYASHPNDFFAKPHEAALVNPGNPNILGPHVGCAAYEIPLTVAADAETIGGTELAPAAKELLDSGLLRERRGRLYWASPHPPAPQVDIRSTGGAPFRIVEKGTGRLIGTVDTARAFTTVHPGAIYLHQGETYRIDDLVVPDRVAIAEAYGKEEYTQAKTDTDVLVLATESTGRLGRCGLFHGLVEVTDTVVGYARKRLPGDDILEIRELDLPPQRLVTRAVWYTLPERPLLRALNDLPPEMDVLLGSLHAAEHAAIGILPVFAMCDRWDIGGLSTNYHPQTDLPTIFIYDGYPMGAGISDHAFTVARDHLKATRDHVDRCPCASGCPACVQSPKCGNWNEPLHKEGAVRVLDLLLRGR
jgi:DEAD/DEAH box helicase domain-containing protein